MFNSKLSKVLLIISIVVITFVTSYIYTFKKANDKDKEASEIAKTKVSAETLNNDYKIVINNNTKITKINRYTKGMAFEKKIEEKPDANLIGMDKDEAEKYFKNIGYLMIEFTSKEVILVREKNSWCPGAFVVKDNEGYITIYDVDNNSNLIFKENTNMSTNMLPEVDKNEVIKGKTYETMDEVKSLISEYSS